MLSLRTPIALIHCYILSTFTSSFLMTILFCFTLHLVSPDLPLFLHNPFAVTRPTYTYIPTPFISSFSPPPLSNPPQQPSITRSQNSSCLYTKLLGPWRSIGTTSFQIQGDDCSHRSSMQSPPWTRLNIATSTPLLHPRNADPATETSRTVKREPPGITEKSQGVPGTAGNEEGRAVVEVSPQ